ncbi:ABC transporter permease [uncultured Massilia sp.]|uniref:ABC transporter permease n=1 Tax=uncultured Massilia sp. TaxID=169973 RepID=UPI0025F65F1A|nr:ABC transporter permease [uncultured Massilia sp.]
MAAPALTRRAVARAAAPPPRRRPHAGRIAWLLLPFALPALALGGAEIAVRARLIPANLMPPPSEIAATLAWLAGHGLPAHLAASILRVAAGFGTGALAGALFGAVVALDRRAARLLDPSLQALRAIPSLAWVPLLLLWFGIDELPKLVLIGIGAFFPVYTGVVSGFGGVDRKLVEVGRLYRLAPPALVRRVLLPAALPAILTGLRNGLALAWMFMVAAELIAASRGLGYLLSDGRETSRADIVLAAIVLLAILGKASDMAMVAVERRLLAWRDTHAGAQT